MKSRILLAVGLVLSILIFSSLSWSEDGAAVYKAKCAMCHGAAGVKGVTDEQAKAVATFVKSLK